MRWRLSLVGVQKVDLRAQKGRLTVTPGHKKVTSGHKKVPPGHKKVPLGRLTVTPGHKKVPRGGRVDSQCKQFPIVTPVPTSACAFQGEEQDIHDWLRGRFEATITVPNKGQATSTKGSGDWL